LRQWELMQLQRVVLGAQLALSFQLARSQAPLVVQIKSRLETRVMTATVRWDILPSSHEIRMLVNKPWTCCGCTEEDKIVGTQCTKELEIGWYKL
jgi:hypothetical protein